MSLAELCGALRASRGFAHKRDISSVMRQLSPVLAPQFVLGDDCAAIEDGQGHLLFAIEGFVEDFVEREPWFAGYCGLMVNVSDIAAMGGRPLAVVDALWSEDRAAGAGILAGLSAASERYGVPIVGGHSNCQARRGQLAVAVIGRAKRLLTSFAARPGDALVMAVDVRGQWHDPYPYWNASTQAPSERLRADLELLPKLAEDGLCDCAKDISMAGAVGTALMLLEASQAGGWIDLAALPRPPEIDPLDAQQLLRWLVAFPSYGFILSVRPHRVAAVLERFRARQIACAAVGEVRQEPQLVLRLGEAQALLWNLAQEPFIGSEAPDCPVSA